MPQTLIIFKRRRTRVWCVECVVCARARDKKVTKVFYTHLHRMCRALCPRTRAPDK